MRISVVLLFLLTMAGSIRASAEDAKLDGQWRGNGGAAFSYSSGNTRSSSLALTADAARQTPQDKLSVYTQVLGGRAESVVNGVASTNTTANQWKAGARYDRNISEMTFGFGGLDFNHDQIQLLSLRSVVSGGLGYHVIKTAETQWDLFGGVSYRSDEYSSPGVTINNQTRTKFKATELLLGEESSSKLSESTSFKQRLAIQPNMSNDRGTRITFDSSLNVTMNKTLSLKVSLQDSYNSLSQAPIKRNDVLLFTGVNVKFGD